LPRFSLERGIPDIHILIDYYQTYVPRENGVETWRTDLDNRPIGEPLLPTPGRCTPINNYPVLKVCRLKFPSALTLTQLKRFEISYNFCINFRQDCQGEKIPVFDRLGEEAPIAILKIRMPWN
jgi:hypothetical protein